MPHPGPSLTCDDQAVCAHGTWTLATANAAAQAVAALPFQPGLSLDASGVTELDGAGAAQLALLANRLAVPGRDPVAGDLPAATFIRLYRQRWQEPPDATAAISGLEALGQTVGRTGAVVGDLLATVGASSAATAGAITHPRSCNWAELPRLVMRTGADGLAIVCLTNLLIGGIVGFMGVTLLAQFGAAALVPQMVALAHVRELGPVMTAIIVAGRSGAGFAAELGSMQVGEEVDALRTTGLDPWRWLVVPRLVALVISLPLLTACGIAVGLLGGLLASLPLLPDLNLSAYLSLTAEAFTREHALVGMTKPLFFAAAISVLACAQGLAARGGATAVGVRTTMAVVQAVVAVIAIDCAVALLGTLLGF